MIVHVDLDIQALIPNFMNNLRLGIGESRAALDNRELDRVRVFGHSTKGAGGGYGFDRISELGAELEAAAKSANFEQARRALDQLAEYLETVEIVYE